MLIYRVLSILLFPALELYLFYRVLKKKEDKKRLKERFGYSTKNRPDGQLIWLHAVSVGEANSALILVDEILKFSPKATILFTTTTLTSASIIGAKLPQYNGRVIHQFLPIDSYFCVQNFFDFWEPRVAIFVESEIWPNFIYEARQRGISSFLVNARMSEKSARKWRIAKFFGFKIFDYFSTIFAQTSEDKKRLEKLSSNEVLLYGNLKSQAQNLAVDEAKLAQLKAEIGKRKIFVAASTHNGEEEIILQVHDRLRKEFDDLISIIILRHPNRADEVKNLIGKRKFAQRSKNESVEESCEIYLCDTLGELGIFYSLTNFAFIGGSLLEIGGHNPFEAIKLNCAIISGSHIFNFKEIYENLVANRGCILVKSGDELFEATKEILNNPNIATSLNDKALSVIKNSENISEKIVRKIDQILMLNA